MNKHTEVKVNEFPDCDFCTAVARYDCKLPFGGWGNLCPLHYEEFSCSLGLGKGQKLILEK